MPFVVGQKVLSNDFVEMEVVKVHRHPDGDHDWVDCKRYHEHHDPRHKRSPKELVETFDEFSLQPVAA